MYWDQWDFYTPLFQDGTLWDIFNRQHGPHRQGIGFILTSIIAQISGWNSRWDAFGVSFVLMGAAGLGFLLVRRCGAHGFGLIVIPLLFLNIRQYEIFVGAANISHGAMPIFLFMSLCLAWFIRPIGWRLSALCFLTFLLIFTGFGLFVGFLVPLVLAVQAIHHFQRKEKRKGLSIVFALTGIGLAWVIFACGYRFDPAVDGFRFPYEKPLEYLFFVASMLNNYHGIRGYGIFVLSIGVFTLAILVVMAIWHGWRIIQGDEQDQNRSVVIFCLAAFTVIYCFETAVGRVFLGWKEASVASRYVTLLIPAGLALYLCFSGLKNRTLSNMLCFFYVALLLTGTLRLHKSDLRTIHTYSDGRLAWKAAYLKTGDERQSSERANFLIYPATELKDRLRFLEKWQLNLFNANSTP
ncbi:MAG: hypothetical protein V2B20_25655 [Pseudomonadota bacterium]